MIHLVADENIVGLDQLPDTEFRITTLPGRLMNGELLADADALWVRSVTPVDEALVGGSGIRFVGTATAGVDHVDQDALQRLGISFASAPGANANAVVEYVLSAMAQLRAPWQRLDDGGRLAVVGFGHVGRRLISVARSLGWRCCVSDPWVEQDYEQGTKGTQADETPPHFVSLDEALSADVISLHCSLHSRSPWPSVHLLDAQALNSLGSTQWLINASRGAVIDNAALLQHLSEQDPVNTVLDVWEPEPDFDDRLLALPALLLGSVHIAGYSWDAKFNATRMLFDAMRDAGVMDAAADLSAPGLPSVSMPTGSGVDAARELLMQRYRILDDDSAIRALMGKSREVRAAAFDRLRRDYPQRRELRGSRLAAGSVATPRLVTLFKALGVGDGASTARETVR